MALASEVSERVARLLSPEHFLHGWRPSFEAEIESNEGLPEGNGDPEGLLVRLDFAWDIEHDRPGQENYCRCGPGGKPVKVMENIDDRLIPPTSRDLLQQATGITIGR
jgi:hypothetical protein